MKSDDPGATSPHQKTAKNAVARKDVSSVPNSGVAASDGRFAGAGGDGNRWQNLSIGVSESVITER